VAADTRHAFRTQVQKYAFLSRLANSAANTFAVVRKTARRRAGPVFKRVADPWTGRHLPNFKILNHGRNYHYFRMSLFIVSNHSQAGGKVLLPGLNKAYQSNLNQSSTNKNELS